MKFSIRYLVLMLLLVSMVPLAYAEDDDVNLTNIPTALSEQLEISLFAAQILATIIVMLLFLLPTLLMTRNIMVHLMVGLMAIGFSVAMGWVSFWFLVILTFAIAGLFAVRMKGVFT